MKRPVTRLLSGNYNSLRYWRPHSVGVASVHRCSNGELEIDETSSFGDIWRVKERLILDHASGDPQPRSLRDIIELGEAVHQGDNCALVRNAAHVQNALGVRIGRAIRGFNVLPEEVQDNYEVRMLAMQLIHALEKITAFTDEHGYISHRDQEVKFCALLRSLLANGGTLATGDALTQLRGLIGRARGATLVDPTFFDHFVSQLLLNSVSWAVLIQHHLQLSDVHRGRHHVGAFDTQLRPVAVARDCAFKTQTVCMQELGASPRIQVDGDLTGTMEYIEAHFRYILTEILKNSAHATVKFHKGSGTGRKVPPVSVAVDCNDEEVSIRVRDHGGGMGKSVLSNIWRFGYTTVHDAQNTGLAGSEVAHGSGLAGWGFGLPRSLVYTRYLGGNITIETEQGIGCDVQITFPKAASHKSLELLGAYV
eukprot:TRINITY_DN444_c0_g2_i2.p1 TRINITY_DN444_c0_g2~~TRINITY_DN444_c0_g2_i2.p1  ORF type:complete len:423 (+),score=50.99 TRINITY_DN444_c0_g2_i2:215-1483(+)